MVSDIEEIPIIWKKPHNSSNLFHIGTLNILLDQFIKRYRDRLQIQQIMIDLEMPKDAAGFSKDQKTQSAVILQLLLIGEIAKKISPEKRSTIDLPWREIAGFRDRAIHNYFEIDLDIVWQTLISDLPEVKEKLKTIS